MDTIKQKADAILERCSVVTLASVNDFGYPRPVPVVALRSEGISTIWISTGSSSRKTKHFLVNSKAGLSFYENGNSIVLTGNVEIVTDPAVKKELWSDWLINHFPGGVNDPEYCVLKFQAVEGTFWIDGEFITENI